MQDLDYLDGDSHHNRQPKQRLQNKREMFSPSNAVDAASGRVMGSLKSVG